MKTKILLLLTISPLLAFSNPKESEETLPSSDETEVMLELIERVQNLEKKVDFLDKQIAVTSEQAFSKYGLYVVRPGDSLFSIAKNHGLSVKEVQELNPGIKPFIEVAQIVRVRKEEN